MSDKCNFSAFVDKKISNKNNSIDTIIEMQHDANINLATNILPRYSPRTVIMLNRKPKPAAPIENFR